MSKHKNFAQQYGLEPTQKLIGSNEPITPAPKPVTQWEYTLTDQYFQPTDLLTRINLCGKEGWELVSISNNSAVLKRRLP